ncbi:hypothetical protein [Paenibacillus sedimenti]|uniref:Uncharacterized protein n=1 Tax=Paenibacillus sedimenti TaxID=2770274 RepID=A0A926KLC3_9BACL|nr:hypothetical protein [Paenibacillus sedimenti]MBD0379248.1 hypothetical protein [Paenibacillus sedimenti]
MIKTQDLKLQIDELTKQNDMVLIELEQVKKMLMSAGSSQISQGTGQNQSQNQNAGQSAGTSGQQASGANQQGQGQAQAQSQNANQSGSSGLQVSDLAYELLKIKDLVEKLEQKTSQYVSSQTNGALTEKDAVNLVLTLMNGMVDWATEFVSSKASSNGQVQ